MFRITRVDGQYRVAHYAANTPNPTPTETLEPSLPAARQSAFGRAASHSLFKGGTTEVVEFPDGRQFHVTAMEVE